jgi:hypothetical protein
MDLKSEVHSSSYSKFWQTSGEVPASKLHSQVFYLFFVLLIFGRYYLYVVNLGNLQDLQEEDFEQ